MRKPGLVILTLSLALGLAACGFRLAGTFDLPEQLSEMYVSHSGFDEAQRRSLQRRLTQAGASLVEATNTDAVRLNVRLERLADRQMATGAGSGANVQRITRQLDFSLYAADGKVILPQRRLTQHRDATLDDDNLLSSDRERESVARDLENALFDQMIRQLSLI